MELRNTNFLTPITFSARVQHEPTRSRRRDGMRKELAARSAELSRLDEQEAALEASEAALAQRLWEVQETRRRHAAMRTQLTAAIDEMRKAIAAPISSP